MAFSAGEYDQRALVRNDVDLLRNDAFICHIMPTRVSGRGYLESIQNWGYAAFFSRSRLNASSAGVPRTIHLDNVTYSAGLIMFSRSLSEDAEDW